MLLVHCLLYLHETVTENEGCLCRTIWIGQMLVHVIIQQGLVISGFINILSICLTFCSRNHNTPIKTFNSLYRYADLASYSYQPPSHCRILQTFHFCSGVFIQAYPSGHYSEHADTFECVKTQSRKLCVLNKQKTVGELQ